MAQKWYQKASVQAALAGGILLLCGAIITEIIRSNQGKPANGQLSINDVIPEQKPEQKVCLIDFRVMNTGGKSISISRVRFTVMSINPDMHAAYSDMSKVYDLNIGALKKVGDQAECPVSQVVEAGQSDRFGITLAADLGGGRCEWILEPSLVTSNGIITGQRVHVCLPD